MRAVVCALVVAIGGACYADAQTVTNTPEDWREDLQVVRNTLPALHANFYFQISQNSFQMAAAALDQQIPQLSDRQISARVPPRLNC